MSVRTAIVGCGKVAHLHAAALRALPESEFVAVCDADAGRARGVCTTVWRRGIHRCSGR